MADLLVPLLIPYWRQGGTEASLRIARRSVQVHGHDRPRLLGNFPISQPIRIAPKSFASCSGRQPQRQFEKTQIRIPFLSSQIRKQPRLGFGFDVFNPKILDQINNWTYQFCAATNATASADLQTTLDNLKKLILAGMSAGEVVRDLNAKVQQLFVHPMRAFRITTTEITRATNGGQLIAAKESGIVTGKVWLASSDACPKCLELDGKEVGIDEAFFIDTKAQAPYQVIMHPPRHPSCMCSMTEVLSDVPTQTSAIPIGI